jgi:hypothetical protein
MLGRPASQATQPPYRLTVGNYLIGYSLWFSLALGVLVWIGDRMMRRWADNAPTIDAPPDCTKRAARSMGAPDRSGPAMS